MKLFFETEFQTSAFLLAFPIGFVMFLLMDAGVKCPLVQTMIDLLVLQGVGFSLIALALYTGDSSVKLFHLLGLVCGALLYTSGLGRCIRRVKKRCQERKAGICICDAEMNTHQ